MGEWGHGRPLGAPAPGLNAKGGPLPAHFTTKVAATSLVLALGLGIALVLGGRLLLPHWAERAAPAVAPASAPPLGALPAERGATGGDVRYRPTSGVRGILRSVGSDSMNNLMALWAELPLPAGTLAEERAKLGGDPRERG